MKVARPGHHAENGIMTQLCDVVNSLTSSSELIQRGARTQKLYLTAHTNLKAYFRFVKTSCKSRCCMIADQKIPSVTLKKDFYSGPTFNRVIFFSPPNFYAAEKRKRTQTVVFSDS